MMESLTRTDILTLTMLSSFLKRTFSGSTFGPDQCKIDDACKTIDKVVRLDAQNHDDGK